MYHTGTNLNIQLSKTLLNNYKRILENHLMWTFMKESALCIYIYTYALCFDSYIDGIQRIQSIMHITFIICYFVCELILNSIKQNHYFGK